MMAARPFKSLFSGAGRNALDLPVAGLAALAAAFAAFAVPQDLLSRAVVATGLPSILSAAQPPLGLTARVVLAVAGALIVFGLVFLLLRLLDRSGMSGADAVGDAQPGPRVRRRDVHPDAPAPRPISAARDLGEPVPPRAPRVATPLWLDEAQPVGAPVPVEEPEPGPEPEPELAVAAEPSPEPEPFAETGQAVEAAAAPLPEPGAIVAEAPDDPVPAPALHPAPEPAPAADMPTSIAELMERLEQGLARRRRAPAAPAPAPQPQVFPEASGPAEDRLQTAIASLQRLAARAS